MHSYIFKKSNNEIIRIPYFLNKERKGRIEEKNGSKKYTEDQNNRRNIKR